MSLIATVGAADANSYVTVAEANAYFLNRAHATSWEEAEDQAQQLITASSVLDWYVSWKGTRATSTQSMDWPREGVYDKFGELFLTTIIPSAVKIAVFELALSSLTADRTADSDLAGIKEVRAGSLLLETESGLDNSSPDTIPEKVWKILAGLTSKSGIGVVRLVRA